MAASSPKGLAMGPGPERVSRRGEQDESTIAKLRLTLPRECQDILTHTRERAGGLGDCRVASLLAMTARRCAGPTRSCPSTHLLIYPFTLLPIYSSTGRSASCGVFA